jgi:hypothetical protein
LERIVKPLYWTQRAFKDLNKINTFNAKKSDFTNAIEITRRIVEKTEILQNPTFDYTEAGSKDESFSHLKKLYRKLLEGNYKITYREGKTKFILSEFLILDKIPIKINNIVIFENFSFYYHK